MVYELSLVHAERVNDPDETGIVGFRPMALPVIIVLIREVELAWGSIHTC